MAGRGGGKAWGGKKTPGVAYTNPGEPNFLKEIKAKLGFKAPATIDDKRQELQDDDGSSSDGEDLMSSREENRPQVVQLKDGHLNEADVDELRKEKELADDAKKIQQGKITFKKPVKRPIPSSEAAEKDTDLSTTASSKSSKLSSDEDKDLSSSSTTKRSKGLSYSSGDQATTKKKKAMMNPESATSQKSVKDNRLLSFNDDEDDEDE